MLINRHGTLGLNQLLRLKCVPILTATSDKSESNGSLYEGSGAATVNDVVLRERMSPAEEYIGYHCHHARL